MPFNSSNYLQILVYISKYGNKKVKMVEVSKNHSVESIKNKNFFIQVNIGSEKTKSGILPEIADDFIIYCRQDLKLNITGLMCIPPIDKNPIFYFKNLNDIAKRNNINHLSMGMSNDYVDGLKCGASYIRVGTLLFGNRNHDN